MRSPGFALCLLFAAGLAYAEPLPPVEDFVSSSEGRAEFVLGGAAARIAIDPEHKNLVKLSQPKTRLSLPRTLRERGRSFRRTAFGGLSFIFGEGRNEGLDVFHLGTAITRGQTTAGVNVTYEDQTKTLESSELYIDYALSDRLSVGISGSLNDDVTVAAERVPQIGLNAELSSLNGAFLQGGVSDTPDSTPIFGIAVGLRF